IRALTRNVPALLEDKQARRWERAAPGQGARELRGATLRILALGKIGSEIARRGRGFDTELRAVDLNRQASAPGVSEVWGIERLDELLRVSDYLAIAIPITDRTRGLIGDRELRL